MTQHLTSLVERAKRTLEQAIQHSRDWTIKGWPKQSSVVMLSKREASELYDTIESLNSEVMRLTRTLEKISTLDAFDYSITAKQIAWESLQERGG